MLCVQNGKPFGYDIARGAEIGHKNFDLAHFEEVFTSRNWLYRLYRLRSYRDDVSARKNKGAPYWHPPAADVNGPTAGRMQLATLGLRYAGCYRLEAAFAGDRIYSRGLAGTNLAEARAHAGMHILSHLLRTTCT